MKPLRNLLPLLLLINACSCNDKDTCGKSANPGFGGSVKVSGLVKHHTWTIPNARVFIKFGATEFPGSDTTKYSAVTGADASAYYEFNNLKPGDYYLYSWGYDSTISLPVEGGIPLEICDDVTAVQTNVPVTEDH